MSSMIEALTSILTDDSTLGTILTGGIYRSELSRQKTPGAFDAFQEVKPSLVIRQESLSPGPFVDTGRLYFVLFFYQQSGFDSIEAARERAHSLLSQKSLPADNGSIYRVDHVGDLLDMEDEALGVSMAQSRFMATMKRA